MQTDNQLLRRMLVAEDPIKYGSFCGADTASTDATELAAADDASQQDAAQSDDGSSELTPPASEAARSTNRRSPHGNAVQGPDLLNSPNLRTLATFLKEAPRDAAHLPADLFGHSHSAGASQTKSKLSASAASQGAPANKLMRTKPPSSSSLLSLEAFDQLAAAGISGQFAADPIARLRAAMFDGDAHALRKN